MLSTVSLSTVREDARTASHHQRMHYVFQGSTLPKFTFAFESPFGLISCSRKSQDITNQYKTNLSSIPNHFKTKPARRVHVSVLINREHGYSNRFYTLQRLYALPTHRVVLINEPQLGKAFLLLCFGPHPLWECIYIRAPIYPVRLFTAARGDPGPDVNQVER